MNSDRKNGVFSNWQNLYIHIPFCGSKCGYCAFYSETQSTSALRQRYLDALLERLRGYCFSEPVKTLYIGGGTPNFLTAGELEKLFSGVADIVPIADDCEISCELNPEFLTADKLSLLNDFVSRLSLGVQSFDENVRKKLMRRCSQEHLLRALEMLRKRRMKHFNIDLIYGIDGVTWDVFEQDLLTALSAQADHLSCYSLTAEENSRLGVQSPLAEDRDSAEWWLRIGDFLGERGIQRYEISNYAAEACCCWHNVNVWRGGSLLGIGAGAAGFDGTDRFAYKESLEDFIQHGAAEFDRISPELRMLEIFAVNLRTTAGWQRDWWERIYPGTWSALHKLCSAAAETEKEKWIIKNDSTALTEKGLLFWDDAAMQILDWEDSIRNEIHKI